MSAANNKDLRMSYKIGYTKVGVINFEPYKSNLLPLWRFHNAEAATKSCQNLWEIFLDYDERGDFVGMDMTRNIMQMGIIRARRYVNYKGGREYDDEGNILPKSECHEGKKEMEMAVRLFQRHLALAETHPGYNAKKKVFVREKRAWNNERRIEDAKAVRRWKYADSGIDKEGQKEQYSRGR
jgi:hypothetical protein